MQAWEQHLGVGATGAGQEKFYSCPGYGEEEVTTIDVINNVVTIPVDTN